MFLRPAEWLSDRFKGDVLQLDALFARRNGQRAGGFTRLPLKPCYRSPWRHPPAPALKRV